MNDPLPFEPDFPASPDAPLPALPFASTSDPVRLPFALDAEQVPALPFSLDDDAPPAFAIAATEQASPFGSAQDHPGLPFTLDDVEPLPFAAAEAASGVAPSVPEPETPKEPAISTPFDGMPPLSHDPSMPTVAKPPGAKLPTMPPVARQPTGSLPSMPPAAAKRVVPAAAPEPGFTPRASAFPEGDAPHLPPTRTPIVTGAQVPVHEKPPMATDVSSALQAMKERLANARKAQIAEASTLLKSDAARVEMASDVPLGGAKPPEIWNYRVGQAVFREGELTYELFMLMEGIVDVYVGNEKVASIDATTAAGAYLGEIGSLLRLPRTATVKAVTSCKFLVFPDARRLFEEDPEFGIKLSTILAQRLAKSNEHMDLVMRALYRAKVKDTVIDAVKGAFQGKESTYVGKKGWFS